MTKSQITALSIASSTSENGPLKGEAYRTAEAYESILKVFTKLDTGKAVNLALATSSISKKMESSELERYTPKMDKTGEKACFTKLMALKKYLTRSDT